MIATHKTVSTIQSAKKMGRNNNFPIFLLKIPRIPKSLIED